MVNWFARCNCRRFKRPFGFLVLCFLLFDLTLDLNDVSGGVSASDSVLGSDVRQDVTPPFCCGVAEFAFQEDLFVFGVDVFVEIARSRE